jgi:hypothetical protein
MFIKNPESLDTFKCNNKTARYLLENGFPLLSIVDSVYHFSKTPELENFINKINWFQKILLF